MSVSRRWLVSEADTGYGPSRVHDVSFPVLREEEPLGLWNTVTAYTSHGSASPAFAEDGLLLWVHSHCQAFPAELSRMWRLVIL